MARGYDRPLYLLPFDHRDALQTEMFGWQSPLGNAQTAAIAGAELLVPQLDRLEGDGETYDLVRAKGSKPVVRRLAGRAAGTSCHGGLKSCSSE